MRWDEPGVAVGAEVDLPAAVVDRGVVVSAEQHTVVDAGVPPAVPGSDVVGVAPGHRPAAAGECAAPVTDAQRFAQRRGEQSITVVLGRWRLGQVIDQRINKRVEISGVHVDTDFHRRCPPTGDTIRHYDPHSPQGAIEPRGDRSRGLCSPSEDGSNVAFELMFDLTPHDCMVQVSCLKTSVTVLHQDIGDTSRGVGGDTSAPKVRVLSDGDSLQNARPRQPRPVPDHAVGERGWTGSEHRRE